MRQQLAAARQENAPVLEEASTLLDQKQDLEKKKQLLDAFNKHFIMQEDDLMILTTNTDTVDEKFFSVLARVKQIHSDCQVLLGSENQRLGLELMEQSSKNLNSGYQKLYRWIQREFKTLNLESPQINSIIRRSLRTLAERPALFQSCLDIFSEARERILSDSFYSALTGSSMANDVDPAAKPIEFHAHDTVRYVGDMLAWTHSATVSEREALETLFLSEGDEMAKGIEAGRQSQPWSAMDGKVFDGRKALSDLVNRNLASVARAVRQRVEQAIQSQEDAVLVYRIANLISFYRVTLIKLLGSESAIMETLSILEGSALRHFEILQSDRVAAVQAELTRAPSNLGEPSFLDEAITQLKALMKIFDSSLAPAESRDEDFRAILDHTLTPFLTSCKSLAKDLDLPANSIFLTNCHLAAKTALQSYRFTHSLVQEVEDLLETSISALADYQHAFFLHVSGVHPLLTALAPLTDSSSDLLRIRKLAPFQSSSLTEASQTLDDFLPSALMDAMENLKHLKDTKLAGEITAEAADRFCEDFEFVEGRLAAADEPRGNGNVEHGGDGNELDAEQMQDGTDAKVPLRSLYPRTSGEIRVLLS